MFNTLIQTIEFFEWCSGLKINWEKLALFGFEDINDTINDSFGFLNGTNDAFPQVQRNGELIMPRDVGINDESLYVKDLFTTALLVPL